MCIMSGPVRAVTATRIFVSRAGSRQFTAYQMSVELGTGEPRAMILPVLWKPGNPPIHLVDMSNVPDFFKKLNAPWKRKEPVYRSLSFSAKGGFDDLVVHDVGDYRISVAPSLEDLSRARADVFDLDPNVAAILSANYSQGYAFVIAILKTSGKFSPLAYISEVGAGSPVMFVPTRHAHGDYEEETTPSWDHLIYSVGYTKPFKNPKRVNYATFNSDTMPNAWDSEDDLAGVREAVPEIAPFLPEGTWGSRISAEGQMENMDLVLRNTA